MKEYAVKEGKGMNNEVLKRDTEAVNPAQSVREAQSSDKRKAKKGAGMLIKGRLNPAVAVLLVIVLVLSCALCVMGGKLSERNEIHRAIYDMSQEIEVAGKSDRVTLSNYSLGEIAIPAMEGVPVCTYEDGNFLTDSKGYKYYYEDGELCSYVGIDVSGHNGVIDWQAVKAAGVDFAMLRIGGRGYGEEGVMYEDTYFRNNLKGAKAAGIMVGAYFFSQAVTPEEAKEEAEYAISILGGASLDYPLAFDWEIIESAENARTDKISPDVLTQCARAFCDTVKKSGYTPALYTGSQLAYYKYDLAQLSDVDIWYAYYNDTPDFYYNYMIWQYSSTGQVDGIQGSVDLNICFKNYK